MLSFRPSDSNHFAWQRAQPINRFSERKLNNKVRENKYESFINFFNSKSVVLKKLLFACLCNVETATVVYSVRFACLELRLGKQRHIQMARMTAHKLKFNANLQKETDRQLT